MTAHTVEYPEDHPAWRVVYWRGTAVAPAGDADRAEVEIRTGGWDKVGDFALPDEKARLVTLLEALEAVYRAGEQSHARKLAALLP